MEARVTTPFGATSTADDVIAGVDLHGKRAVVTGAGSGIGAETARALAAAGAEVTLAVRDVTAGEAVARGIVAATGNPAVRVRAAGPGRPGVGRSVRRRMAGAAAHPRRQRGRDGHPGAAHAGGAGAAVRHQPPRPLPARHRAARRARGGRARAGRRGQLGRARQRRGAVRRRRLRRAPYDPWAAYSQSKTANVLFAVAAAKRWASDGISVNALNPGGSRARTSAVTAPPPADFDPSGATGVSVKDIPQGAATSVLLAASPLVEGVSGAYFEDAQEAVPYVPGVRRGVAAHALDPALRRPPLDVVGGPVGRSRLLTKSSCT